MTKYVIRRLLLMVVTLLGVSLVTFGTMYIIPADPASLVAGERASNEVIQSIRHQLGLDQPIYVQYARYLWRTVQGDLGSSWYLKKPVTHAILERLPATLQLAVACSIFQLVIGVPLGVIAALKNNTWVDRVGMFGTILANSFPEFWLGLILIYVFGFLLGIFPMGGYGGLKHVILPALAVAIRSSAWYSRMLRGSMLEILSADYVRTAHAKGLRQRTVVVWHIMRNALGPLITIWGMDFGFFFSGLVVVEAVFGWPGIGWLGWTAVRHLDVPLIMGTVLFAASIVIVMNLLVDLSYAWVDPRVSYS